MRFGTGLVRLAVKFRFRSLLWYYERQSDQMTGGYMWSFVCPFAQLIVHNFYLRWQVHAIETGWELRWRFNPRVLLPEGEGDRIFTRGIERFDCLDSRARFFGTIRTTS